MSDDTPAFAPMASSTVTDVAKYKKLLSIARNSLEGNQKKLAELTRQKEQLLQALEEEMAKNKVREHNDEDVNSRPSRVLRRVDVADKIWLLLDYSDGNNSWMSFNSEQESLDYISRLSGEPLELPHRCFTPEESLSLENECRRKIELLGEEFRRFKVQTSIALKQRDAQLRSAPSVSFSALSKSGASSPIITNPSLNSETIRSAGHLFRSGGGGALASGMDEVSRWKAAYEDSMAENERLRSRGEEAAQSSQWRERFETCERERNEALDRLQSLLEPHSRAGRASGESDYDAKRNELLGPGAIYQRYLSLKEEFEITRKKLADAESSGRSMQNGAGQRGFRSASEEQVKGEGYSASRVQHSRHLVLQYLSCKDKDVRVHMEDALIALFRATEEEKAAIMQRRRMENGSSDSYVSSLSGIFGLSDSLGGSHHGMNSSTHGGTISTLTQKSNVCGK